MRPGMAINRVEDVGFYLEDDGVTRQADPGEIRDVYYGPLDDRLSEYEMQSVMGGGMWADREIAAWKDSEAEEAYGRWASEVKETRATAVMDMGGEVKTYDIWPRMDFSFEEMNRSPNVLFLHERGESPEEEPEFVIRQWRDYGEDILRDLHNCRDVPFDRTDHDDYRFRYLGTSHFDPGMDSRGEYMMLPEPYIEAAFHREGGLYEFMESEGVGVPVTPPNIKIVGEDGSGAIYALRPYRAPAFRDLDGMASETSDRVADAVGAYYGTMAGLGLLSCFDDFDPESDFKPIGEHEYFWDIWSNGPIVVNGDPEYLAVTKNPRWHEGEDFKRFRKIHMEKQGGAKGRFIDGMKAKKSEVESELADVDVLDFVPRELESGIFPSEKKIASI